MLWELTEIPVKPKTEDVESVPEIWFNAISSWLPKEKLRSFCSGSITQYNAGLKPQLLFIRPDPIHTPSLSAMAVPTLSLVSFPKDILGSSAAHRRRFSFHSVHLSGRLGALYWSAFNSIVHSCLCLAITWWFSTLQYSTRRDTMTRNAADWATNPCHLSHLARLLGRLADQRLCYGIDIPTG